MSVRALTGFIFATLCSFESFGQGLGSKMTVSAENVYVSGLLVQSALILGGNVAVGGYSKDRITISGSYANGQNFLKRVAAKIGARTSTLSGVEVFAGNCAGPESAPAFNPFSEKRVTLNFNGMEPTQILNMLQYLETEGEANYDYFPDRDFGLVGISVKNLELSSVYAVLASASGVTVETGPSGKLVASRRPGCKPEARESYEAPRPELNENTCPRLSNKKNGESTEKCRPLEFYKLENIILRGRVSVAGKAFALAETVDGITWLLKPGDYLGHDYGRVLSITDKAVTIREIVRNPYGHYYEQKVEIDFRNKRRLLPSP